MDSLNILCNEQKPLPIEKELRLTATNESTFIVSFLHCSRFMSNQEVDAMLFSPQDEVAS